MIILATICCVLGAIWRTITRQPPLPSELPRAEQPGEQAIPPTIPLAVPPRSSHWSSARRAA